MANLLDDFERWSQIDDVVQSTAQKYGVDPALVHRVIKQESAYNPKAVSKVGAQGLMQLMPPTAKELGVADPFDPSQNIEGGVKYLAQMLKRYGGDTNKALMAYNAGPGAVDSGRAAAFPETKDYVQKVGTAQPQQPEQPQAQAQSSMLDDFAQWDAQQQQAKPEPKPEESSFLDKAVDWLPDIGAAAGGIIGGIGGTIGGLGFGGIPGAMGGAAIGGAGGKGFKDAINMWRGKTPITSTGQELKDIALEGAKQAAIEGVGGVVAKPVEMAGKALVKTAFKSPALKVAIKKQPELVESLIEHSIGPNERGVAKAAALTGAARNTADTAVAQSGVKDADIMDIVNALYHNPNPGQQAAMDIARGEFANLGPRQAVLDKAIEVLNANGTGKIPLERVREGWRGEGRAAGSLFNQLSTSPYPALEKVMHADLRRGAATALNNAVPGLAELDADTALKTTMKKVAQARVEKADAETVSDRALKHIGIAVLPTAAGFIGGGVPGAIASHLLAEAALNPTVQAATGRALYKGARPVIANAGRAIEHAVESKKKSNVNKARVDALYELYNK